MSSTSSILRGDIKNPNYRPVSLLSILSKVFERHIFSLISDSVAISENQWGFQPGKSTSSAVLLALYSWEALLDKGQEVLVTFLDIKKAFDSVPHRRLLSKLCDLHIPEQIVALINSYLCDHSQQVCVNGTSSAKCHVSSGVPQGSVLGPLLFMLYIDDIAQVKMSDGSILLYADDICLYRPILSCSDVTTFQDIDILTSKISNLGLDVSIGKCKFMLLSRKKSSTHVTLSVSGLQLEQVSSYTYLGFLVTSNLSWSPHIQHLCTRARRQLGIIYRQFYKANANTATLKVLYISRVHSVLEYGACVWDPHLQKDIDSLEGVQRLASKICTRDWSSPYIHHLSVLNLDTLSLRRTVSKLCFLYKMVNNLVAVPFPLHNLDHGYGTRSHDLCLRYHYAHSNSFLNSFTNSSVRLWNNLPPHIVHATSINSFKTLAYK